MKDCVEMTNSLSVQFDGDDASRHMLPLYEGSQSLSGLGLCFTRVAHYLSTGTIKQKAPYYPYTKIFVSPPKSGSVVFDVLASISGQGPTTTFGQLTLAVTANLIFATGVYVIQKVVGKTSKPNDENVRRLLNERPGDVEALIASVQPAVKQAHNVIGAGANVINIYGSNNNVTLDQSTKDYVSINIVADSSEWISGSVGWLNANERTGGMYVHGLGRVVPFEISRNASSETLRILLDSLSDYTMGNNDKSRFDARVLRYSSLDGRIKKFVLVEAAKPDRLL
jgi:hypothetical protein